MTTGTVQMINKNIKEGMGILRVAVLFPVGIPSCVPNLEFFTSRNSRFVCDISPFSEHARKTTPPTPPLHTQSAAHVYTHRARMHSNMTSCILIHLISFLRCFTSKQTHSRWLLRQYLSDQLSSGHPSYLEYKPPWDVASAAMAGPLYVLVS